MMPVRRASVQIEVLDDPLQARAAENLLSDRLQPILDSRRHGGPDVALGHPLRHDQNQRVGAKDVG